jgi:hypothetical protein
MARDKANDKPPFDSFVRGWLLRVEPVHDARAGP